MAKHLWILLCYVEKGLVLVSPYLFVRVVSHEIQSLMTASGICKICHLLNRRLLSPFYVKILAKITKNFVYAFILQACGKLVSSFGANNLEMTRR